MKIVAATTVDKSALENCKKRSARFDDKHMTDDSTFRLCMSAFHGVEDLGMASENVTFLALFRLVEDDKRRYGGVYYMREIARNLGIHQITADLAFNTWIIPFTRMVPQTLPGFPCTMSLCPHSKPEHWFDNRDDLVAHMLDIHTCNRRGTYMTRRSPLLEEEAVRMYKAGEFKNSLQAMSNISKRRINNIMSSGPQKRYPDMKPCGCCRRSPQEICDPPQGILPIAKDTFWREIKEFHHNAPLDTDELYELYRYFRQYPSDEARVAYQTAKSLKKPIQRAPSLAVLHHTWNIPFLEQRGKPSRDTTTVYFCTIQGCSHYQAPLPRAEMENHMAYLHSGMREVPIQYKQRIFAWMKANKTVPKWQVAVHFGVSASIVANITPQIILKKTKQILKECGCCWEPE
ncbi:hypothetical protein DL98DRAFT_182490 [Cadophora sp. DSE1049]|nr:hypothetical protein DL98DRAFT_182490 [Cadophora sp. DSE1049]